jgi:hypothetical protein
MAADALRRSLVEVSPLFCASAALFQLFAMGRNLQSMRLHGKAKTPADLVSICLSFSLSNSTILSQSWQMMWL